jgi:hypothetical protein
MKCNVCVAHPQGRIAARLQRRFVESLVLECGGSKLLRTYHLRSLKNLGLTPRRIIALLRGRAVVAVRPEGLWIALTNKGGIQ